MRRFGLVLGVALSVTAAPGFAQDGQFLDGWEGQLRQAWEIARSCARDVVRLCGGVAPGEDRIKACVKAKMDQLSPPCHDALAFIVPGEKEEAEETPAEKPSGEAPAAKPSEEASAQKSAPSRTEYKFTTPIPPGIAIPDTLETRFGTLNFFGGFPDKASTDKLYDNLDFQRAVQAYLLALPVVSQAANRDAILKLGPANFTVPIWETMVDSRTTELTANNNTPYTPALIQRLGGLAQLPRGWRSEAWRRGGQKSPQNPSPWRSSAEAQFRRYVWQVIQYGRARGLSLLGNARQSGAGRANGLGRRNHSRLL